MQSNFLDKLRIIHQIYRVTVNEPWPCAVAAFDCQRLDGQAKVDCGVLGGQATIGQDYDGRGLSICGHMETHFVL
jgi:hypothetical protein